MATVSTQALPKAGLAAPTYSAASAGGDKVTPGPGVYLHVKNASAGAIIPTIVTPGTVDGLAITDRACVSVPAGGEAFIPVTNVDLYRNTADGLADITWSASASVTFAVLRV